LRVSGRRIEFEASLADIGKPLLKKKKTIRDIALA
jgi:hypothetical protein